MSAMLVTKRLMLGAIDVLARKNPKRVHTMACAAFSPLFLTKMKTRMPGSTTAEMLMATGHHPLARRFCRVRCAKRTVGGGKRAAAQPWSSGG